MNQKKKREKKSSVLYHHRTRVMPDLIPNISLSHSRRRTLLYSTHDPIRTPYITLHYLTLPYLTLPFLTLTLTLPFPALQIQV